MGRRQKPRFRMVLPVSIWGTDSAGKPFNQLAHTLDISVGGARVGGISVSLNPGDIVGVRYKQRKARFRVAWSAKTELGIKYLEGERFIWIELPEEEYTDRFRDKQGPDLADPLPDSGDAGIQGSPAEMLAEQDAGPVVRSELAAEPNRSDELADTLEKCLTSLRKLNDQVNSAGTLPQAAQEFHAAAGHLRNTAWAVWQWVELQPDSPDKRLILESVNSERVRFATQLCRDLVREPQYLAAGVLPENREALAAAVRLLAQELGVGSQPSANQQPTAESARRDPVALLAGLNEEIRSTALSAEEALLLIAERARSFTDADGAAIALHDEDDMVCRASSGIAPLVGIRFSVSGALVGEAVATRQSVLCRDAEKDERVDATLCRSLDLRSSAIVPVVVRDSVAGVLQVFASEPNAFDEVSVFLLQHLAELVASLEPNLHLEVSLG